MLLSIVLVFFSSCGDNDEKNVAYLNNQLIEGIWHRELKTEYDKRTIDSTVLYFGNNTAHPFYYVDVNGLDTLKFEGKTEFGRYLLTDSIIIFLDFPLYGEFKIRYKLRRGDTDSLFLYNQSFYPLWSGYTRLNK